MAKKQRYVSANPAYIAGMRELRRSNASGTHLDRRTRRNRSREQRERRAINDSKDE